MATLKLAAAVWEHHVRVKVCGFRRAQDVILASKAGVDAIGILVGRRHRSEDFLELEEARELVRVCPPLVTPVLVTHYDEADSIVDLMRALGVATVQIHSECGSTTLGRVRKQLPDVRLIRAVHATGPNVIEEVRGLSEFVDAFVVDSINVEEDRVGGTGRTHDWMLSKRIVALTPVPVILAGGLDSTNVTKAVQTVRPYGVDANTRLRDTTGNKSADKVAAFVRTSKSAFLDLALQEKGAPEHGFEST